MSTGNLYKASLKVLPIIENMQKVSKIPQLKEIVLSRRGNASLRDRYKDYNPVNSLFRSLRPRDDIQGKDIYYYLYEYRVINKIIESTKQTTTID